MGSGCAADAGCGVSYPLSYAPVVWWEVRDFKRYEAENGFIILGEPTVDGFLIPLYRPIDWLIDNTPLDKPMFVWARLWGVEDEFHSAAFWRSLDRSIRPRNGIINL